MKLKKIFNIPKDVAIISATKTNSICAEDIDFDCLHQELKASKTENLLSNVNKGIENAKKIDISRVPVQLQNKLLKAHIQFADVFSPDLTVGYNGYSGQHFNLLMTIDLK